MPVRALGRRVLHIRSHTSSGDALLCAYWDDVGTGTVIDTQIRFAVKYAATALDYRERGIPIDRVDTHSLRYGGACALKLSGHSDMEIMKQGRWSPMSTVFTEYIQQQLSTFSVGFTTYMSHIAKFTNMEGTKHNDDLRAITIF